FRYVTWIRLSHGFSITYFLASLSTLFKVWIFLLQAATPLNPSRSILRRLLPPAVIITNRKT
ncbi:MAG: hypothetical protein ACTTKL_09765, partial [Treponema sp.]